MQEMPIEQTTEEGFKTSEEGLKFDMIIYATGFDAGTGSFDPIDVRGLSGRKLKQVWKGRPKKYLGLTVKDFPNM